MKKFLTTIIAAVCAVTMATGFSACTAESSFEGVSLMAVAATDVGTVDTCDYFVAAEPAASTRSKATGLNFVGNMQSLYGSDNGYPQAVVVAKNSLIDTNYDFIRDFIDALIANQEWLTTVSAETIVEAISSHLPDGTTPTFNSNNLTSEVIANCGINFVYAYDDKERVTSFLAEMAEVDSTSVGEVSDSFFLSEVHNDAGRQDTISIYAPDGAPALALAQLMYDDNQFYQTSVTYNIVSSDAISAYVTGESPVADICILPLNAASKLLGSGETYTILGTVTNGNLYILSKDSEEITSENIVGLLSGKTIGVIQLANVPGLTLKIILNKYGLEYQTIG